MIHVRTRLSMKRYMRSLVFLVGLVILQSFASAADEDDVSKRMQDYWSAYSRAEFSMAASFVIPSDLNEMKAELLPVFLTLSKSTDPELQPIAAIFFSGIPVESYLEMSPLQVFIGLNRFIFTANPQLVSAVGQSTIEVTDVSWSTSGEATVSYRMIIQNTPVSDFERFKKHKGQWYMRLKEAPSDTAYKFRQAFGL